MSRADEVRESYRTLGRMGSLYDGMVSCSTPVGRALNRLMWGFTQATNDEWLNGALAGVAQGFSGNLLEVPVGTGVLTMPLYMGLPAARVTCLDYSEDMMGRARARAGALGVTNVRFVQGDAGALPFADESFDAVLSLNGFHAFPNKDAAFAETFRVLRPGGTFCGCFYVKGGFARTDWFVEHLLVPKGAFTPPFETAASLESRLSSMYASCELGQVNAEAYFVCQKA